MIKALKSVFYWGVSEEMPITQQKVVILHNKMLLLTCTVLSVIGSVFLTLGILSNVIIVGVTFSIMLFCLFLNRKRQFLLSKIIFGSITLVMPSMSIISKIYGQTLTLEFVIAPRMGIVLLTILVMLLSIYEKPIKIFLVCLPGIIGFTFFEEIHAFFGIVNMYELPIKNVFMFRLLSIITFLGVGAALWSLQDVNVLFEGKIRQLLALTAEKNEELERQNEIIGDKNRQITHSIQYAQRIQKAILGEPQELQGYFPESFVFFQPRDIVSGDFYWFSSVVGSDQGLVNSEQPNSLITNHLPLTTILVAADCTGHGVPGAFMTVMGANFLEEIINDHHITQPSQILKELDQKIVSTTNRQASEQKIHDGMDLGLLKIDQVAKKAYFSGAKNSLYWIRNQEITEIKASKYPIGSLQFQQEKVFDTVEIDLQKGDIFYLASDGFQDQFGGEERRKYMTKRFRALLLEISGLPMNEQGEKLRAEWQDWKGNLAQTDDILVMGVKIEEL